MDAPIRSTSWLSLAFLYLVSGGSPADAVDFAIPGKFSQVRPGKLFKFVARGSFTIPGAGSSDDPTLHGATLRVFDSSGSAGQVVFDLGATGWKGLGNPARSKGYRYRGKDDVLDSDPRGTCRVVIIEAGSIKALCRGPAVALAPPFAGSQAIVLTTGANRYCADLGGTTVRNNARVFRRKNAPPPGACVGTPSPTATPTTTPTATATPTATPTLPLDQLTCNLDENESSLFLQFSGAGVLVPPSAGSIEFDCGAADGSGVAACSCQVGTIAPVSLLGIGDLCIDQAGPCADGAAYCAGGFPADLALRGDHNIDTICSDQATCAAQCDSHCTGLGAEYSRLDSACEGFCSGGTNADGVCVFDSECPGGYCPGLELNQGGPDAQVCQCTCTAAGIGAPAPAGTLTCNLGLEITIERDDDLVCGNSTPSIALPPMCAPLTTAFADAFSLNANNGPYRLPPQPNGRPCSNCTLEATGSFNTCGDYAGGNLSDLSLVGYLQFYDSALGDILAEPRFVCQ